MALDWQSIASFSIYVLATIVCLAIGRSQSWFDRRATIALVSLVCLIGVAVSIYGYEPLVGKLRTLSESRDLEQLSAGRKALWNYLNAMRQVIDAVEAAE